MNHEIEIDHATVSYRENIALHDISLTIEKKSFVAVVGPNGAGKTTLLTLINGLGALQRGMVKIFGLPFIRRTMHKIRQDIGYVPQHLSIDARMPILAYDVVMMGRYPRIGLFRQPGKKDHAIVNDICQRVGIAHLKTKPIGHLSGGESQKVSLARALAQQPRILLLDEPTANLDPLAQHEITEVIEQEYERTDFTVLFVTHLLNHLPPVCSHAILLKKGKILARGSIHNIFTKEQLAEVYDHPVDLPVLTRAATRA